jgi:hypothetical protein
MSTSGGDLKALKGNFDSLVSSLPISWRIVGNFTSLVSSSPTRGDYGHDGMEGWMDKKNEGVH